jgi:hypothetical protein
VSWMAGDAGEDVGEPALRIDIIYPGGGDQARPCTLFFRDTGLEQ